jgi:hypothetical protein
MRAMVTRTPIPCGYAKVRHVEVSLPRIDCLITDQPAKYVVPESAASTKPDAPPRRGPRYTSHDNSTLIKKRFG